MRSHPRYRGMIAAARFAAAFPLVAVAAMLVRHLFWPEDAGPPQGSMIGTIVVSISGMSMFLVVIAQGIERIRRELGLPSQGWPEEDIQRAMKDVFRRHGR
ncbi:hypothetical protein [Catellatospora tritici]|uniref:hypothetical protein n=1 Tax=Catellatospora tritici TaxID=2851566 RepID=UPI001C2D58C4|nr:hypothetical protein [Catellatospora tritici]MBV1852704.1 hypothetical protein [Catellatospora tritici]